MAGSLITNYLAQGTAAARPASPTAATGTLSFYFASDTETLSIYDWNDGAWQTLISGGVTSDVTMPQGRLTLTTAVPVLTASVTGATTIYYALYNGAYVPIWNGATTDMTLITELSQATTDNTKSPAAVANNSNYDMFVWNDGGTKRCTRGPLWTSDTGRGSGAGTTQITRNTDGYYTNTVAITNGPGAGLGTYVGTVRSNGTASIDMIFGGTGAAGGEACNLGVWNMYNRVDTPRVNFDNTDTWNYTTATFRVKNGNSANRISLIVGLSEDTLSARNSAIARNSTANITKIIGIGLDSETVLATGSSSGIGRDGGSGTYWNFVAHYTVRAPLGFHYIAPLELSGATGTTTWSGDNGDADTWTSFQASIRA
jgi:hypothetical protein